MSRLYEAAPVDWQDCGACGLRVMNAWDGEMNLIALDPDPDSGGIGLVYDGNPLPWCRSVGGAQLELGETLWRLHDPACAGLAARVRAIGTARTARHREAVAATGTPGERRQA